MTIRTLYIEDNENNRYLVDFLLKKHGHEVILASDGPDGIELARQECPDLILLDIQLPHMDGYEVFDKLRAIPSLNHVPIIAVTSYAMSADIKRILAKGCNGYIAKPIDPDVFAEQIESYLDDGD